MSLKVLLTTNIPSPYFVDYANELSKYVDLTVLFELKNANDRDKRWINNENNFKFKYYFLNAFKTSNESGLSFKIKKYLKDKSFNRIIIANPLTPTGIVAILYCKKHKIPYIIQSEGGIPGSGKGLKEKFKKYLLSSADFYLTGMGGENDYFMKYGATLDKLKRYNFTSLHKDEILKEPISNEEKIKIRNELNLKYKKMILYVGQFIDRKDVPTLLKAFNGFNDDHCLVCIGGEETKAYKEIKSKLNLKNVFFIPFINKESVIKYYKASDLFVLPTKEDTWGLVINEAMAYGLPVISTYNSVAALQLIKDNVNGYLNKSGDYIEINNKIKEILNDNTKRNEMGINSLKIIRDYSIENMALSIFNFIK